MAVNTSAAHSAGSIGTSADTQQATNKVRQLAFTNTHASNVLYVRVFTARTAAAALALAAATPAVVDADENVVIPAGKRVVVFQSRKPLNTACSVIASGASTTYATSGTQWTDAQ